MISVGSEAAAADAAEQRPARSMWPGPGVERSRRLMALGCGHIDLRVAASETSAVPSSSQEPGTRNRVLASFFFAHWHRVVISEHDKTFVCVMGE